MYIYLCLHDPRLMKEAHGILASSHRGGGYGHVPQDRHGIRALHVVPPPEDAPSLAELLQRLAEALQIGLARHVRLRFRLRRSMKSMQMDANGMTWHDFSLERLPRKTSPRHVGCAVLDEEARGQRIRMPGRL